MNKSRSMGDEMKHNKINRVKDCVTRGLVYSILFGGLYIGCIAAVRGCAYALHLDKLAEGIGEYYQPKTLRSLGDINKDGFQDFEVSTNKTKFIFYGQENGKYTLEEILEIKK